MTVAEVNALLYKPGHPKSRLERALRIPALSAGWRRSLAGAVRTRAKEAALRQAIPDSHRPVRRRRGRDSARCG